MRAPPILLALILLIACKGDPDPAPATTGSAAVGPGSGSGRPSVASRLAGVTLPASAGTPPKATTAALDAAAFARLAKLAVPGFTPVVRSVDHQLDVVHATPSWTVNVMVAPCFDCAPMELATWKTREAGLRLLLPAELRDRPDTVWEIGDTELHGQRMIFTHQLGHAVTADPAGTAEGSYSHAYALYYNDETNQIRVIAEVRGGPGSGGDPLTRAALEAIPRDDLARLAIAFLDVYTHAW
jgi:hypothetical protein